MFSCMEGTQGTLLLYYTQIPLWSFSNNNMQRYACVTYGEDLRKSAVFFSKQLISLS